MISKTFCVLPWYSEEIMPNYQTVCCLLSDHKNLDKVKSDLLQGKQSPACNKCWSVEQQGKQSRRQQENIFLDYKLDRDIEKIYNDCLNGLNQTLMYQIALSNLCNQACVTCSSQFSSRWAEIEKKMQIRPNNHYSMNLDELNIDFSRAQRISIIGGEPLFEPLTYQLLQKLLDHGNDQCFIALITNGSIGLNSYQTELFSWFKNKNICVSIDGIESRFEYLRWPGRWTNLLKNLDSYRKIPNTNVSVSYTISSLNAVYYNETVTWFKQENLNYNHNMVYSPNWAGLKNMPVVLKKQLHDHEVFSQFAAINGKEILPTQMLEKITAQDTAKKISIIDYMPDLYKLLTCQ